jgi:hypothetical protein
MGRKEIGREDVKGMNLVRDRDWRRARDFGFLKQTEDLLQNCRSLKQVIHVVAAVF